VILVAVIICLVGLLHQVEASSLSWNLLQVSQELSFSDVQVITIDGVAYHVSFKKIDN